MLSIAACLTTTRGAEAATPYWRCSLDRLTVITNGSAARCERLIRTTVRYEQLLVELTGGDPETSMPPLTLYSLTRADAKQRMFTERQLAEQTRTRRYTTSKYLPGPDVNIAAIIDEGWGRVAAVGAVHLRASVARLRFGARVSAVVSGRSGECVEWRRRPAGRHRAAESQGDVCGGGGRTTSAPASDWISRRCSPRSPTGCRRPTSTRLRGARTCGLSSGC